MLLCDQLLLFLFEFKLDLLFCFPAGHYFDVFVAERDLIDLLTSLLALYLQIVTFYVEHLHSKDDIRERFSIPVLAIKQEI